MNWGEFAQLLTSIGVVGTLVRGILSDRKIRSEVAGVKEHVEKVEKATNGMKHELVEEVRKASFAKGVKSETDKTAANER